MCHRKDCYVSPYGPVKNVVIVMSAWASSSTENYRRNVVLDIKGSMCHRNVWPYSPV